jgi:hypothetical protein
MQVAKATTRRKFKNNGLEFKPPLKCIVATVSTNNESATIKVALALTMALSL